MARGEKTSRSLNAPPQDALFGTVPTDGLGIGGLTCWLVSKSFMLPACCSAALQTINRAPGCR
jgi:hypothetical protein